MRVVVLFPTLLCLLILNFQNVHAQSESDMPPILDFTKTVSPSVVSPGEVASYAIQFINPPSQNYAASIVVSDTLDARLALIPESRKARNADGLEIGTFQDPGVDGLFVAWTYAIQPGDVVTVTFDVIVNSEITETQIVNNDAVLFAVGNQTETLNSSASLRVNPRAIYLPFVSTALQPLPRFLNGNFESGSGTGWSESPPPLVYRYSMISLPVPDGDHQNTYMAWLGGARNQTNELTQQLTLPRGYTSAGVRYKYWVASQEVVCGNDTATLIVGANSQTFTYDIRLCSSHNTQPPGLADGWRSNLVDLSSFVDQVASPTEGTQLSISFKSVLNDNDQNSNLWLDDIELCSDQADAVDATRCTN